MLDTGSVACNVLTEHTDSPQPNAFIYGMEVYLSRLAWFQKFEIQVLDQGFP